MAGVAKKTRTKMTPAQRLTAQDKHLKELIKQAVREVLAEERAAHRDEGPFPAGKSREELVALALLARENWLDSIEARPSLETGYLVPGDAKYRPN